MSRQVKWGVKLWQQGGGVCLSREGGINPLVVVSESKKRVRLIQTVLQCENVGLHTDQVLQAQAELEAVDGAGPVRVQHLCACERDCMRVCMWPTRAPPRLRMRAHMRRPKYGSPSCSSQRTLTLKQECMHRIVLKIELSQIVSGENRSLKHNVGLE